MKILIKIFYFYGKLKVRWLYNVEIFAILIFYQDLRFLKKINKIKSSKLSSL